MGFDEGKTYQNTQKDPNNSSENYNSSENFNNLDSPKTEQSNSEKTNSEKPKTIPEKLNEFIEKLKNIKDLNTQNKNNLISQLNQDEELKNAFRRKIEDKFKTSTATTDQQDLIEIQVYGKVYLNNQISIDGKSGSQTNLVKIMLRNRNDTSPETLIPKIKDILAFKNQKQELALAIDFRNQLLQQARNSDNYKTRKPDEKNVLETQIYAYLYLNENESFVDGKDGTNTQTVARILQGEEAKTEKERKWQEKHHKHKKEIEEHRKRSTDYLNPTSSNSPKSMKEFSILDIRGNTAITEFLKNEKNPITDELTKKRHREGVIKAIASKVQLNEDQISLLLDEEGKVIPEAKKKLSEEMNISEENIKKIMKELHYPDYTLVHKYLHQQIREATKEKEQDLKAINDVLQYIKEYLNITTQGEHLNFGERFNRNPNSKENLNIDSEHITIKGTLQDTPPIPISFSYNMKSGKLSTNNIVEQTTTDAFIVNNTEANTELFDLGNRESLKNPDAEFKDLRKEQEVKTIGFNKQRLELNIEKNRTLNYLITSFQLDKKTEYPKNQSPGMYHLFQILGNSLQGNDNANIDIYIQRCKDLRDDLKKLNQLIGNKDLTTPKPNPTTLGTIENNNHTTNEGNQVPLPSTLQTYFTPDKRSQDIGKLGTTNDTQHGLYQFLKKFVSNLDNNNLTVYNEYQHLDINKLHTEIIKMDIEQQRLKEEQKDKNEAEKLIEKIPNETL